MTAKSWIYAVVRDAMPWRSQKGVIHNVVGFDRSHYLIDRARKINKTNGLNVIF